MSKIARRSGVLLHPSSFPSPWGIGDLGHQAMPSSISSPYTSATVASPTAGTDRRRRVSIRRLVERGNPLLIVWRRWQMTACAPVPRRKCTNPPQWTSTRFRVETPGAARCLQEFQTKSPLRDEFEASHASGDCWMTTPCSWREGNLSGQAVNQWPDALVRRTPQRWIALAGTCAISWASTSFSQFAFYRNGHGFGTMPLTEGSCRRRYSIYMAFDSADVWRIRRFALIRKPTIQG